MKKILALLLAMLMVACLFTACGKKTAADGEDELRLMWTAQSGTDSIFESPWKDSVQCLYTQMVFEPLLCSEADGSVVYKLASAHTVSDDGLTYTFTVRDGVKWHDGEALTAEDVAFSLWGALADPYGSYKTGLLYIEGADQVVETAGEAELSGVTVEGNTVTVQLTAPYSQFLSAVAKIYILPQHLLGEVSAEQLSSTEEYWKKPVGTGAYAIDEVSFPDYATLVRNAEYWGPEAGIGKVLLTSYATGGSDAVANALSAGELDFATGNEVNNITVANSVSSINSDVKVLQMTSNYQRQFLFNWVESADGNLHPDFAKKEVRQAINLLIDKEAIAAIYGENASALTSHLNPDSELYDTELTPFKRDVETAKTMLADAGFDFSHPVRIAYYYDDQSSIDAMDLVVQNLAEAGINASATLLSGDLGTLIYVDRNYDMLFCGEAADDPGYMYEQLLGTGGYFNDIIGGKDERAVLFDEVVQNYYATSDAAQQKAYAWQLQENGVDYCAIAPVVTIKKLTIYNTARLSLPEEIFDIDWSTRDWRFEDWKLLG